MDSSERLRMDQEFQKIAETRRPRSLEWLEAHRTRMERMRLEPEFQAYATELNRAKLEDLGQAFTALLARLNPDGQRGMGHIGPPPTSGKGRN